MFGFGKKDQTEAAFETLHQAHINLFLKVQNQVSVETEQVKFGIFAGYLEGANQMAGNLISGMDGIKNAFGKGTPDKADKMLKILTLKMAYTGMWIDNDTRAILENPSVLPDSKREDYLLSDNELLPVQTVIDVLCEPSEKSQMAEEFILLESHYANRMRQPNNRAELRLLNTKIVFIANSREIDLRQFSDLSSDPVDSIFNSGLVPLSIQDRLIVMQAESDATDAMLAVFAGEF